MPKKFTPSDFEPHQKLYRGFDLEDFPPDTEKLYLNSIDFPDLSCNWSRFSDPSSVRERPNANKTDGCYSFTVRDARYKKIATPCHDPDDDNYSHTEVRQLKKDESVDCEPPKNRRLKSAWASKDRAEYRQNIINELVIELEIGQSV